MRASSLCLAALLAAASFSSANAGFAGRPFFAPHAQFHQFRPFAPPPFRPFPPVANGFARNDLAHRPDRFRRFFPGVWWGGGGTWPTNYQPPANVSAESGPVFGGPSVSLMIVNSGPQYYGAAPRHAYYGGPKIITIGPKPHNAHAQKLPVVIYGSSAAQTY